MSREEFWKKWNPDLTQDELVQKAKDIDEAAAKSRQVRGQIFPSSIFTVPEKKAEEEETE